MQQIRIILLVSLTILALSLGIIQLSPLHSTTARSQQDTAVADLLANISPQDGNELQINNAACGVAAATMLLDYYLLQSNPNHALLSMKNVNKYVVIHTAINFATGKPYPAGTDFNELANGIMAASTAQDLDVNTSLTAMTYSTNLSDWFSVLKTELDNHRPVIVFIPNGENLGEDWGHPYGHFIVVSGYTDNQGNQSVVYHDPWEGKIVTKTKTDFGSAWGTIWNTNPAWYYTQITLANTNTPVVSTSVPTLPPTQFSVSGMWKNVINGSGPDDSMMTLNQNGSAITGNITFINKADEQGTQPTFSISGSLNGSTISLQTKAVFGDAVCGGANGQTADGYDQIVFNGVIDNSVDSMQGMYTDTFTYGGVCPDIPHPSETWIATKIG